MERTGDIRPSQSAAVIRGKEENLMTECMAWGFPRFDGKGLLINARAESALERKTFRDSIQHRRCIIRRRDSMSGIKVRKSSPMNAKMHRVLFNGRLL